MQPSPANPPLQLVRGEVWWVNFNSPLTAPSPPHGTPQDQLPTTGDEIYKLRPAVVMNITAGWNLDLSIIVPITSWQDRFQVNKYFWMVYLPADASNGLLKDSAANTFQVKSVSVKRFVRKIGMLSEAQMDMISATIAFCIGYKPPKP
jgi:mRNA interferase MazF